MTKEKLNKILTAQNKVLKTIIDGCNDIQVKDSLILVVKSNNKIISDNSFIIVDKQNIPLKECLKDCY